MSTITIQIPEAIEREAEKLSARDGVTVTEMIVSAFADKLASVNRIGRMIDEQSSKADDTTLRSLLDRVPDIGEPIEDWDKLP